MNSKMKFWYINLTDNEYETIFDNTTINTTIEDN